MGFLHGFYFFSLEDGGWRMEGPACSLSDMLSPRYGND